VARLAAGGILTGSTTMLYGPDCRRRWCQILEHFHDVVALLADRPASFRFWLAWKAAASLGCLMERRSIVLERAQTQALSRNKMIYKHRQIKKIGQSIE
jgi:hypothetical protein